MERGRDGEWGGQRDDVIQSMLYGGISQEFDDEGDVSDSD